MYPREEILSFRRQTQRGLSLVELIITITILSILAVAVLPMARLHVRREKERELRRDLWEIRDAIDRYNDMMESPMGMPTRALTKVGSEGYPPDLETLVKGVNFGAVKVRFLRRIPVDPMTGKQEWGLRSMQDDPESDSWGGQNVFDVYSKSEGTALDGTKYKDW